MDKFLKPQVFDIEPNLPQADKNYLHWKKTFDNFIKTLEKSLGTGETLDKLPLLENYISASVYEFISECSTFNEAEKVLKDVFVKPKSEIFARHMLASRKQESAESADQYLQALNNLSKDCNFQAVSSKQNRDDCIRDSFIAGLKSQAIRQRLLENKKLTLEEAFDQVRALELAQKQSESYLLPTSGTLASVSEEGHASKNHDLKSEVKSEYSANEQINAGATSTNYSNYKNQKCYFCGNKRHPRNLCPARESECGKCRKIGHYARACKSTPKGNSTNKPTDSTAAALTALAAINFESEKYPIKLSKSSLKVKVNGIETFALIDSGSTESFIDKNFAESLLLDTNKMNETITLASTSNTISVVGFVNVKLQYLNTALDNQKLFVFENLCSKVLLGLNILSKHSKLEIDYGGSRPELKLNKKDSICSLASLNIKAPPLFGNLTPDVKPIADKSRAYSKEDYNFIKSEVARLLKEKIIEPSHSPWRAQVLVVKQSSGKKRLVVDYSRTINRFTQLDAYPLPRMDHIANEVSKYKYYTTLDLKSAYHQVPIQEDDKQYTAFEAAGRLYQYRRIPFGCTNGVSAFQRVMDQIIDCEGLKATFCYLDNITIGGNTKEEHDENLQAFTTVSKKYNLTFNETKSIVFSKYYLLNLCPF